MANTFKRADSGFNPDEGRRPNLADRHGQHSVPYRVQERISCYTGLLDWETLEGCLAAIWPYETRETLQPKMVGVLNWKAQKMTLMISRSRISGCSQHQESCKM